MKLVSWKGATILTSIFNNNLTLILVWSAVVDFFFFFLQNLNLRENECFANSVPR